MYLMGKNIVTQSLTHTSQVKLISRQAKLTCLDLSPDAKALAVGDEVGKIYVLYNFMELSEERNQGRLIIQSLP